MTREQKQARFDELQEAILADAASVPDGDLTEFCQIAPSWYFPRMVEPVARPEEKVQTDRCTCGNCWGCLIDEKAGQA